MSRHDLGRRQVRRDWRPWLLAVVCAFSTLAAAQADGGAIYAANCAACHGAAGAGIPGVFPPLAGHVGPVYAAEGGPRHLSNVLLFGMQGPISVAGQDYDGVMPGWFQMDDEQIAAVLDHVLTAWGDDQELDAYQPITVDEVATARRGGLSPQLVYQRRPVLEDASEGEEAAELTLASFTQAQVDRILPVYMSLCEECHGDDFTGGLIGGPPLRGFAFINRWGGQSVAGLYTFTKSFMPQGSAGSLSDQQYADLMAMILNANGHAAGEVELPGDLSVLQNLGIRSP